MLRTLELEIVLGRLLPRERLVEDELMDRLGAKRNHVRTALIALEGMGLVERRPNRGSVVRTYDAQEVEELTAFRADLHRMAVAQMPLPLPTPVLAELADFAAAHEAAVEAAHLADVVVLNDAFHDRLFEQCQNRFLSDSITKHGRISRAFRSYRIGAPELLTQAAREHRRMIELAAQGGRAELSELVVQHIMPSVKLYLSQTR